MPKKADAATAERLKELADAEVAAAKERLTKRTEAAARFANADARLIAARTAWDATQGEAATEKAAAVEQLLETGMKPGQVAELLGIDAKGLRTLRATRPAGDANEATTDPSTVALSAQHSDDPSHEAA